MIHCAEEFQNIILSCFDHAHMVIYSYSSGLFIWLCTTKKLFLIRIESTYHRSFVWPHSNRGYICLTFISSVPWGTQREQTEAGQPQNNTASTPPGENWPEMNHVPFFTKTKFLWTVSQSVSSWFYQHIHYSCERQGEHVGKLGLAADLWCLINGASVLQLGSSGPESCWVLKWWSDKQRNRAKTNTSSIQLFISNWKGRAQSRTSDLIWRIASALWIYQTRQQDKPGGFSLFGEDYFIDTMTV